MMTGIFLEKFTEVSCLFQLCNLNKQFVYPIHPPVFSSAEAQCFPLRCGHVNATLPQCYSFGFRVMHGFHNKWVQPLLFGRCQIAGCIAAIFPLLTNPSVSLIWSSASRALQIPFICVSLPHRMSSVICQRTGQHAPFVYFHYSTSGNLNYLQWHKGWVIRGIHCNLGNTSSLAYFTMCSKNIKERLRNGCCGEGCFYKHDVRTVLWPLLMKGRCSCTPGRIPPWSHCQWK